ncbi:MAG: hypothetical protein NZM04_08350, partial [Methylacidiphilales bacterium]|nr:hypothetical protein [Candidatus Methylacidiphilales bacterium]
QELQGKGWKGKMPPYRINENLRKKLLAEFEVIKQNYFKPPKSQKTLSPEEQKKLDEIDRYITLPPSEKSETTEPKASSESLVAHNKKKQRFRTEFYKCHYLRYGLVRLRHYRDNSHNRTDAHTII